MYRLVVFRLLKTPGLSIILIITLYSVITIMFLIFLRWSFAIRIIVGVPKTLRAFTS